MTDDKTDNECGICLETLNSAVTLPCSHKFCAECLDGWKSKFGCPRFDDDMIQEERSKSCPLCRKRIPPSKDMMIQLEFHRAQKRKLEARGDTTSAEYMVRVGQIKRLEAEIGDYDGEGIDYDGKEYTEIPEDIFKALETNNIKKVQQWLGSPVDKKRLNARHPDLLNSTLLHLAVHTKNSDMLSILLQYGADIGVPNAEGFTALNPVEAGFERAKILLEWGVEISLPNDVKKNSSRRMWTI